LEGYILIDDTTTYFSVKNVNNYLLFKEAKKCRVNEEYLWRYPPC
jgi:hypothetical protein